MISYQWDKQTTCLAIKENLEQAGYTVWMDVEKMVGDLNDRMAEAVDNSGIILVCMSEKYQNSKNCQKVKCKKNSSICVNHFNRKLCFRRRSMPNIKTNQEYPC